MGGEMSEGGCFMGMYWRSGFDDSEVLFLALFGLLGSF